MVTDAGVVVHDSHGQGQSSSPLACQFAAADLFFMASITEIPPVCAGSAGPALSHTALCILNGSFGLQMPMHSQGCRIASPWGLLCLWTGAGSPGAGARVAPRGWARPPEGHWVAVPPQVSLGLASAWATSLAPGGTPLVVVILTVWSE